MKKSRNSLNIVFMGLALSLSAFPLSAFEFSVPESANLVDDFQRSGSIALPIGTYGLVSQPRESISGKVERQAWVIDGSNSAYELTQQLINQYQRQGFEVKWQCDQITCGGFDFRYGIEVAPRPEFLVNLDEFYYADLRNGDDALTILASAIDNQIYLQQSYIQAYTDGSEFSFYDEPAQTEDVSSTARWTLATVSFDSGKSIPSDYSAEELQTIKDRLDANLNETVYIVGHSDQSGGLDANLAITQARANAVRDILVNEFGVDPSRIEARGVAFLAPIADNATEEGRAQNRRVEAVFLTN